MCAYTNQTSDTNLVFSPLLHVKGNLISNRQQLAMYISSFYVRHLRTLNKRTTNCAPQTHALIYAQVKDPAVTPSTEKSN